MPLTLEQFAQDLQQSILADSGDEEAEDFVENVFTRRMMESLADAGEMTDGEVCHHQARGIKINGYAADYEDDRLDLVVSIHTGTEAPSRVEKARVEAAFRQVRGFLSGSLNGLHSKLEESSPAFALAQIVHSLKGKDAPVSRVRVYLLTDGLVNAETPPQEDVEGLTVTHHVRDLEWLFNWESSGRTPDKIEIDFSVRLGMPLPCLAMPVENSEYQSYLAIVPGDLLMGIYSDFGARLLERNVRSFLQAKGAVNRGIRKTLADEPHRFLAYNNGLTATAESVHLTPDGSAIARVSDLQIVNGGQTTASIFHASRRDRADLSKVYVQMKLSVVHDQAQLDGFVEKIAGYANSQNKVNIADFSANAPFHRRMEELSRNIWAPVASGAQNQTRWFYERARGQFADARNREGTSAKIRTWDKLHPRSQMFAKTDLAKFENTWMQRPHSVSRGAQTNFAEFTVELSRRPSFEPDARYFQHMAAKAILFRRAEKIIGALNYGGYRANIVTYTLAYLSHTTKQCIDLDSIWKTQEVSSALRLAIETVSKHVHSYITNPPGGRNVTQWCKRDSCWQGVRALKIELPDEFKKELRLFGKNQPLEIGLEKVPDQANSSIDSPGEDDKANIDAASEVSSQGWLALSAWAKATGNLEPWQRKLTFDIGRRIAGGATPSHKQAHYGLQALEQARELGFNENSV